MGQLSLKSHLYVRWIFLRILALCFLAAFVSIAIQVTGLYGEHGILPIKPLLSMIELRLGFDSCINFPSIFWLNASDGFLQAVCWAGAALSLLAFCGILTGPVLALLWFLYLSIVSVGQDFMGFQWDSLLLETALLSIWFAPWGLLEKHPFRRSEFEAQAQPSYLFLCLLRLLCFKLMLFSGICKLASADTPGDPNTWRNLTAMAYHYETQPLPTPLAWLMQKLPPMLQAFSTAMVIILELGLAASLVTLARPARCLAACAFALLMLLIMLTGNYAFFNWLTIALSLTLVDDEALFAILPRSARLKGNPRPRRLKTVFWNTAVSLIPAIMIGLTSISYLWIMLDGYLRQESAPAFVQLPVALSQPLRSFNSYGLFAHMTTSRPEIIIEGSNDGINWLAYEFKYKPGDVRRAPPLVAPHQPRLDWQMWFAALGPAEQSPWFDGFVRCLLDGSPQVLGLLERNPFPNSPPRLIRGILYDYHFSDFNALFSRGEWWRRKKISEFYPATARDDLRAVYQKGESEPE